MNWWSIVLVIVFLLAVAGFCVWLAVDLAKDRRWLRQSRDENRQRLLRTEENRQRRLRAEEDNRRWKISHGFDPDTPAIVVMRRALEGAKQHAAQTGIIAGLAASSPSRPGDLIPQLAENTVPVGSAAEALWRRFIDQPPEHDRRKIN